MINFHRKILLGSGSPRRKLLLRELGFDFRTQTSDTAEIPLPHLVKGDVAVYLAEEKADFLKKFIFEDEILVTADTIVCLDESVLGKPGDSAHASEMLRLLSGKTHQVFTAICLIDEHKSKSICVQSNVTFHPLSDYDIKHYIEVYHPFDKAGSYGAQECLQEGINPCSMEEKIFLKRIGENDLYERTKSKSVAERIPLIDHIEGSYFNVMGLPIIELVTELENWN